MPDPMKTIGRPEIRKDAWDKVTGAARFTPDVAIPGETQGVLIRSPHHHARIIRIEKEAAEKTPGVLMVLTAVDIPGNKLFGYLGVLDQPVLASQIVRHMGEPVAYVIAQTRSAALLAAELVRVDYEVLEAVFDPQEAASPGAPRVHAEGNVLASFDIDDGNIEAGFGQAQVILEETFSTPPRRPGLPGNGKCGSPLERAGERHGVGELPTPISRPGPDRLRIGAAS